SSLLAVISVTAGKRYRFRLVSLLCDPNFKFSIDNHTETISKSPVTFIDSVNHVPLTVDSIHIFAGQRYSLCSPPNQLVDNYWIRIVSDGGNGGSTRFDNAINSVCRRSHLEPRYYYCPNLWHPNC
ncbi:multicopper oxidase-domain-containing protein, partial [Mycena epipterygia]